MATWSFHDCFFSPTRKRIHRETLTNWDNYAIDSNQFGSVHSLSHVGLYNPMDCSTPGFPVHYQLPELVQTRVHWVSDAIQPSYPLSSPSPPAFNLSQLKVFSKDSVLCIRWPKYWSFNFSISPSHEYPQLISFRTDWFDLLAVQGTLKSLLQHHSSKASILWCSAFFIVQLSHPYMTTGKTIALTRWTFVGKVMSLLFNMQSRLVIAFLPMSKHLLISWLQSPSAVILEPKKIKSLAVSIVSPSICHEVIHHLKKVSSSFFPVPLPFPQFISVVPLTPQALCTPAFLFMPFLCQRCSSFPASCLLEGVLLLL